MKLKKYRIEFEGGVIQEKYLVPSNVEYFTEKSPLGIAIKTGIMELPPHQGGKHKVNITCIDDDGKN